MLRSELLRLTLPVLALCFGLCGFDRTADAQGLTQGSPASLRTKLPAQAPAPLREPARVQVFVFRDNLPVTGLPMTLAGRALSTDENGTADFALEVQDETATVIRFLLTLEGVGQAVEGRAVSGETTQVFVNLLADPDRPLSARLEEPVVPSQNDSLVTSGVRRSLKVRVVNDETGERVAEAKVFVPGLTESVVTNEMGEIEASVPARAESLTVTHDKFTTRTERTTPGEEPATLEVRLRPSATALEDFVVLAPQMKGSTAALIEVRRKASGVSEVLGSEQMAKAGDGDAAASLRRVTGLTLIGGKFVYVRGLGERYSSTLFNNSSLPSPEPSRRVVPLDLFPTTILESMIIQKSYSPELPGEFGGGAIQMFAKSFPDRLSARIAVSTVFADTEGSLGYSGGALDWLGRDDGTRSLPQAVRAIDRQGRKIEGGASGMSDVELRQLGKSFGDVWQARPKSYEQPPNLNFSVGGRAKKLGYMLSGLYGTDLDVREREDNRLVLDQNVLRVDSFSSTLLTEREVRAGLTGDLGYEFKPDQRVFMSSILVRNSSDSTKTQSGFSGNDRYLRTELDWVERQIWQNQVRGEHKLAGVDLGWRLTRTQASRLAPDSRSHAYIQRDNGWLLSTSGDLYRNYSELGETVEQVGVDVAKSFSLGDERQLKLKTGLDRLEKRRHSQLRRFDFQEPSAQAGIDLSQPIETIFDPSNFDREGGWTVRELTRATDSYRASQRVTGFYTNLDFIPSPRWQFTLGARSEMSRQDVVTFNLYDAAGREAVAGLESHDILPVYAATWKFKPENQLRLAYAETLSRPDLKELSTAPYYDDESGQEVKGYPALRGTVIRNWDLRWEWYPSADESVSVGGFAKTFVNPIELILVPQSSASSWTFRNAKQARNLGIELEARRSLRFLSRELRRWTIASNLAFIDSRVELDERSAGVLSSNDRPLQGQSPYIANLQAFYDHKTQGWSAGLLYNVVGRRIREVASAPLPDVYEEPFHQLDFVSSLKLDSLSGLARASHDWLSKVSLQFRAKNLLDPDVRLTQGDEIVRRYKRGRAFSVGLSASL